MRKLIIFLLIVFFSAPVMAETITLVTYYPGPIGVYSQLRLTPHDTVSDPITCDASNEGLIYYDALLNLLVFCGNTGASVGSQVLTTWVQENNCIISADPSDDIYVGIGDFEPDAILEISASAKTLNYLFLSSNDNLDGDVLAVRSSGNLGIGSTGPSFRLTLDETPSGIADGGIFATGIYGAGTALAHTGEGTKFIWYPPKSAFRAGYVDDDQWDDANIGNYSVALGYNATALGLSSTSFSGGIASGDYSLAIGEDSQSAGDMSTSIGLRVTSAESGTTTLGMDSTASGLLSTSMGNNNASLGAYSVSLGFSNIANSTGSMAIGNSCTVTGDYSAAFGESNKIEGASHSIVMGKDSVLDAAANYSVSIGHGNTVYGVGATALGSFVTATGDYSFVAGGPGLDAQAFASAAFGRYNVIYGGAGVNSSAYNATDPILVIGNGTAVTRSNAFTIRKNANVAIGSDDPAGYRLRVYGGDANIDAANLWTTASDRRLKKDIQPLVKTLEHVSLLQGVTYHVLNEQEEDKKHIGVIAQELEEIYPEIVSTADNGYKSVDYGRLSAVLVEAVKDLKKENEQLNQELDGLIQQLDQKMEELNQE